MTHVLTIAPVLLSGAGKDRVPVELAHKQSNVAKPRPRRDVRLS